MANRRFGDPCAFPCTPYGLRSAMRRSRRSPSWLERYNDSTATTQDFQAVYEQVSGRDLGESSTRGDAVWPGVQANRVSPQKLPSETPGGQVNTADPVCSMYSIMTSCDAKVRCIGTN